jgi:PAS domain S-box-containing protein
MELKDFNMTIDPPRKLGVELEDRFFPLFQHAAVGFAQIGLRCEWLRVNRKLCEMTGYTEQALLRMTFKDITYPDDLEEDLTNMQSVMAGTLDINVMEKRYIRKDGDIVWVHLTATLVRDEEGQPSYFITIIEDITQRKLAEAALKDSETRFRTMFEQERLRRKIVEIINQTFELDSILSAAVQEIGAFFQTDRAFIARYEQGKTSLNVALFKAYYASDAIPVINPKDFPSDLWRLLTRDLSIEHILRTKRFTTAQEYYADLTARLRERQHLSEAEKERAAAACRKIMLDQYGTEAVLSMGIYYRGIPYGAITLQQCHERVWQDDEVCLLQDLATQMGVAFYQMDLYEQEQQAHQSLQLYTDKLAESNKELERFATIASHDLQEPLRKIHMFSQMIAEHASPEGRSYVDRMQSAVHRMQNLITDLLALSRVNRKGQAFRKTNLNDAVRNVLSDLDVTIQELAAEVTVGSLAEIDGDPKQIEQLFLNLLENALKFRRLDVKPLIRISGQMIEQPGQSCYRITVKDNGIGFKKEYAERIFQPFERLHGKTSPYHGTGVGLAICTRIAQRHSGDIIATSTPAKAQPSSSPSPCAKANIVVYPLRTRHAVP